MAFYLFAEWAAIFRPLVLFPSNLIRAWCEARVPGLWKHGHDPKVRLADKPGVDSLLPTMGTCEPHRKAPLLQFELQQHQKNSSLERGAPLVEGHPAHRSLLFEPRGRLADYRSVGVRR